MAQKITGFKFGVGSGASKYDWSNWLNGEAWKLTRGEDFESHPSQFRTAVYNAARKCGKKAKTQAVDENTIIVQARPLTAGE